MNSVLLRNGLIAAVAFALLAALLAVSQAKADAIADFYKGRKILAISGGGAGGGFSFNARVLGRHIVKHIPGNPEWVVQAMPGAGGARSVKFIENAAAPDGTVVGVLLPPAVISPLLRKGVGYDSTKLQWLGSITPMSVVSSVWHTAPAKNLAQAKKNQLIMATSSKLSNGYMVPAFMNAILGTKFKVIAGYRGGDRQNNAMEKGEVNGRGSFYNSYKVTKPHWLSGKKIFHLVQLGPRIKDLPNVPHIRDLVKTDEQRQVVRFLETGASVGHGFFVSSRVPRARVAALRKAFDATMKDPAYLADAKKRNLIVDPISGAKLQAQVALAMKTPRDVVDRFKKLIKIDKLKPRKRKKKKAKK